MNNITAEYNGHVLSISAGGYDRSIAINLQTLPAVEQALARYRRRHLELRIDNEETWVAVYWKMGVRQITEFNSLLAAVDYLFCGGEEDALSPVSIIDPAGTILAEGDEIYKYLEQNRSL